MGDSFMESVATAVRRKRLIQPGQTVLVAVSGGPDSVALLDVLRQLAAEPEHAWRVEAAHLHHGLRGDEADADARFVHTLCAQWAVPLHSERLDVRAAAEREKLSLETAARQARYAFLARVATTVGADRVALAHHANDQAETVLFRIVRGTGLRGLAGMPVRRRLAGAPRECRIVRPMLGVSRDEILAYLDRHGLGWQTDLSNRDPEHRRNFLRHSILPPLAEHINSQVVEALGRLAGLARRTQRLVDADSRRAYRRASRRVSEGIIDLDADALADVEPILVAEVIRRAVRDLGVGLGRLDRATLDRLTALLTTGQPPQAWDTACGVRAERTPAGLRLSAGDRPRAEPFRYEVRVPGLTELDAIAASLAIEVRDNAPGALDAFLRKKGSHEELLSLDELRLPLLVRSRQPGDGMVPFGMTGRKKLQDLLVDLKIPAPQRDRVPILCDAAGPVWVIPHRLAERVRVRPETRRVARICFLVE